MVKRKRWLLLLCSVLSVSVPVSVSVSQQLQLQLQGGEEGGGDNSFGEVQFDTSCDSSVQEDFNTALSMLYSFWYSESLELFDDILVRDPVCCMAHWGASLTYSHPVWDFIEDSRLEVAAARSDQALQCALDNAVTAREVAYATSLAVYTNMSDPALQPADRLQQYADDMYERVYLPYPEDSNAGIMYGLALIAVGYYSESEPADEFPSLKRAGLVNELVLLDVPDSPGALHYVIHSYDQPGPAPRALDAAYHYLNVSVKVPHAIHMPSHIFGDLGLWDDMIEANIWSMNTAYDSATPPQPTGDWYHGSYFLQFGMLQNAMDCDASALVDTFLELSSTHSSSFNAEAGVRVPTMYLTETRQWEMAAEFNLSTFYDHSVIDVWTNNPWTEITSNMMVTAARAILNYPTEEITSARQAVDDANHTLLSDPAWTRHQLPYWRLSFNIMVESARAWEAYRLVSADEGISLMRKVRDTQVTSWAPEVAHAWDANEQLAEMLLMRGSDDDVVEALEAYEMAIDIYPNRYHSTAGAAKCADMLGDDVKASSYYGDLLALTSAPFPDVTTTGFDHGSCPEYSSDRRPEIVEANEYFAAIDGSNGGDSSDWPNHWVVYLVLSFISGGIITIVSLLVVRRKLETAKRSRLLSSSQPTVKLEKAKNSF